MIFVRETKRATKWSAYYFTHTHANSYYPVPQTKVSLRDIPKIKCLPVRDTSKQDQDCMRQWTSEPDDKAVSPGGGGGDSHMKQTGMLVGNFEFNP